MPRNAAGTYTLPASNPVVTGTPIQSGGWANPTMSDIGNEITNSLDRGGRGGMTGPFGVTDGSAVAPGLRFTNDPDNGLYRDVANSWWLAAGGLAIMQVTSTGVTLAPGMIASNFGASVDQNDGIPPDFIKGDLWFESDTGNFYVQYQNPDLTFSVVGLNSVSAGPYVPLASVGAINGVAPLDPSAKVPSVNLYMGVAFGIATLDGSVKIPIAQFNMSPLTNSLGANVPFGTVSTYVTGPQVAQGVSGTWFVSGTILCSGGPLNPFFNAKLWDGTTIIASTSVALDGSVGAVIPLSLSGIITNPAGNLRISASNSRDGSGQLTANINDGTTKASTITAIRIA